MIDYEGHLGTVKVFPEKDPILEINWTSLDHLEILGHRHGNGSAVEEKGS